MPQNFPSLAMKKTLVTITKDLKPSKHCLDVVKTANKLSGIGRAFEYKCETVIFTLSNALLRPHLEYCIQFWSSYHKKSINKLEEYKDKLLR